MMMMMFYDVGDEIVCVLVMSVLLMMLVSCFLDCDAAGDCWFSMMHFSGRSDERVRPHISNGRLLPWTAMRAAEWCISCHDLSDHTVFKASGLCGHLHRPWHVARKRAEHVELMGRCVRPANYSLHATVQFARHTEVPKQCTGFQPNSHSMVRVRASVQAISSASGDHSSPTTYPTFSLQAIFVDLLFIVFS